MKTPFSAARKGFTLAEVMIALAIVASVMVALMGMIPLAVRSVRESSNLAIMGRVAQEIISNIQMSDWKEIEEDFEKKTFQYDNDGLPYESSPGQFPNYEAKVELPKEAVTAGDLTYRPDFLRRVIVTVEFTPNGYRVEKRRKENTQTFNFFVANQSKVKH